MPLNIDLKPLEEIFRANLLAMLKKEGKSNDDVINSTMSHGKDKKNLVIYC